jgi:hypothetical protein
VGPATTSLSKGEVKLAALQTWHIRFPNCFALPFHHLGLMSDIDARWLINLESTARSELFLNAAATQTKTKFVMFPITRRTEKHKSPRAVDRRKPAQKRQKLSNWIYQFKTRTHIFNFLFPLATF